MLSDCSSEQSIKKSTFGSLSMPGQPIRIFSYSDLQSVFLHFILFPDVTQPEVLGRLLDVPEGRPRDNQKEVLTT